MNRVQYGRILDFLAVLLSSHAEAEVEKMGEN